MVSIDFAPLFRSTIGFDHLLPLLRTVAQSDYSKISWPPYNIEKCGDDEYRIVLAVAGFTADDLEIVLEQHQLVVRGTPNGRDDAEYLHRGLVARAFERRFHLAEFVEVKSAVLESGILTVSLKRELPENLKLRKIAIAGSKARLRAERSSLQEVA